jgi:hypothetical protein
MILSQSLSTLSGQVPSLGGASKPRRKISAEAGTVTGCHVEDRLCRGLILGREEASGFAPIFGAKAGLLAGVIVLGVVGSVGSAV